MLQLTAGKIVGILMKISFIFWLLEKFQIFSLDDYF